VGAVIVPRISTKNPIGWLMLISSLAITLNNFSAQYAIYALLA
jgi:hypothetical protein